MVIESMPNNQFHFDFEPPNANNGGAVPRSSEVVSLCSFRMAKQEADLGDLYREIFNSVSHVQLDRVKLGCVDDLPPTAP